MHFDANNEVENKTTHREIDKNFSLGEFFIEFNNIAKSCSI